MVVALTLVTDALAQRGGGMVSGGMRGAVVGGMVGGSSGAQNGAKLGAVAGATRGAADRMDNRNAMYAENQARAQYETTAAYQSVPHSNFIDSPPDTIISSSTDTPAPTSTETVVRKIDTSAPAASAMPDQESSLSKDGKPILWITYPSDWKQKKSDQSISAVSADGHAWSGIAIFKDAKDKQAGLAKVKGELEKYLENVSYDEPSQAKGDSLIITGTGKAKKAGSDVAFAAGVFDAGPGDLATIAFVADKDLEDQYKEAARSICQTIRTGSDLGETR
jgi:hypothetical protein